MSNDGNLVTEQQPRASQSAPQDDPRLVKILEEYRAALEAGRKPDRQIYLTRHPDLAAALNDCFDGLEFVFTVTPDMQDKSAHTSSADLLKRSLPLGDYRIVREIGRGGMGVVYEAEQLLLGRRVALKVLPFAATMDARQLQRFHNEARAAACLHHPNIVPVHAVGCERGIHYYAMQFIEGQSLAEVITDTRKYEHDAQARKHQPDASAREENEVGQAKKHKPEAQGKDRPEAQAKEINRSPSAAKTLAGASGLCADVATLPIAALSTQKSNNKTAFHHTIARLGMQIAEALHHAHEVGVIHRDIKPANLMLDGHGNVWVTDFGLAQIQGDAQLTMTGDLIGTLRYMSPEQALAKRILVDHRTDIYSLGATLYELLTMAPVFEGADRQVLLREIAFEEPKPLRRHNKSIPAELETIVMKALEKNPVDRYATAKELAEDLERFVKDEPIKARRPSLARRAKQWCRRHTVLVTGAAVFVLMALLLGGVTVVSRERRHAATVQAVTKELEEADIWQKQQRWDLALKALERAAGRLDGSGPGTLQNQVDMRRRDAALVVRLEEARLKALDVLPGYTLAFPGVDRAFARAFAEFGLDASALSAEEFARQIQGSAIRTYLVSALDNWAYAKEMLVHGSGESLRAVARLADDDNRWRQKLRDQWAAKDRRALESLAQEQDALHQPPANLLILHSLLVKAKLGQASVKLLRRAQELFPADFWLNLYLGIELMDTRTGAGAEEAVGFCRAALVLQPQNPIVYRFLADSLHRQQYNQQAVSEAAAACLKAIALRPDYSDAYRILGSIRRRERKLPEAVAAFQKAIELKPNNSWAYLDLGSTLRLCQKPFEAEAAFRKALELVLADDRYYGVNLAIAYSNLGAALFDQKKLPEAEAAFRKAIEFSPGDALGYMNLGGALVEQNLKLTEAEAALRKAMELDPNAAMAYNNLGAALFRQQKYLQALEVDRKAINLKLLGTGDLYNAACAAALAGCGKGDAAILEADEYARLRGQSLAWLRGELGDRLIKLEKDGKKVRAEIHKEMEHWQQDTDFNGVRGEEALAKLPEGERREWRKLWEEVEELRKRAEGGK